MATFGTRLKTWLSGKLVGEDQFGNRYYRGRGRAGYRRERRWVIYNGPDEASRVPPMWHGWLHYVSDDVPDAHAPRHIWQQPHEPNKTGTAEAYRPPGSVLTPGDRAPATADYKPWSPP